MKQMKGKSGIAGCLMVVWAMLVMAGTAISAEGLRIDPVRHNCGIVDEGVVATMTATVENIGSQIVNIKNVRTN